jgi:hypothetical protein
MIDRSRWHRVRQPPHVLARRALRRARHTLAHRARRHGDAREPTYCHDTPPGDLLRYLSGPKPTLAAACRDPMLSLAERYRAHCFDILGSGWMRVARGVPCRGLEGHRYEMGAPVVVDPGGEWLAGRINGSNLCEAQRIWSLVEPGYVPIDWQLDVKSGYRWSETTWYMDVPLASLPGRDVKVPWELARCHHLHPLASAYALTEDARYAREYRNQVLDFAATNPPRFGVNWRSGMDVAIRIANWLMAHDLLRTLGVSFDDEFERVLRRSVYEHGRHIVENLDWDPDVRGNHYLSEVVGLLFVGAYLTCMPQVDAWLAFAVQELVTEVEHQFGPDGAHFEASTSYHRLAAEMVAFGTALVFGLPPEKQRALWEYDARLRQTGPGLRPAPLPSYRLSNSDRSTPFPPWYLERLERMAEFTLHLCKPTGQIPQIGDNDSGRFLKLQPVHRRRTMAEARTRYANLAGDDGLPDDDVYWDEDHLDHGHLVAAVNGLFRREDLAASGADEVLDGILVRRLAGGVRLSSYRGPGEPPAAERVRVSSSAGWSLHTRRASLLPEDERQITEIVVRGGDLRDDLRLYGYPDFGLYLFRSRRLYLAVRCGAIGQCGKGGHAHNDQLSLELNVDGRDWITDPGTYLYTPLPDRRNEYRSVRAHFAPHAGEREPSSLDAGLFRLGGDPRAQCLYFGTHGFCGVHRGYGRPTYRIVELLEDRVRITDTVGGPPAPGRSGCRRIVGPLDVQQPPLSPGYGVRCA